MKNKIWIIIVIIILIILLIPRKNMLWDGGSIEYKAILYKITRVHKLAYNSGYYEGTIIEFLGIKIYDNTKLNNETNIDKRESDKEEINSMKVIINNKHYNVILEDNETTKIFINMLPKEFIMNELNGNEKYIYMDESLPTNSFNPNHIEKGDIMLYGNNCLVIFYKSFDTSYQYTKIGHIENLDDIGSENITVIFKK